MTKKIYEAMAYSLEAGGKRIRPVLLLNTYALYKEDYKKGYANSCCYRNDTYLFFNT